MLLNSNVFVPSPMKETHNELMGISALVFFYSAAVLSSSLFSSAADILTTNKTISESDTLVSASESFELGFFSPGNSKNRYLGLWYKKIGTGTIVWVANRAVPGTSSSGLKLTSSGLLQVENSDGSIIWSSNSTRSVPNPVAQLLDNGNFVVRDARDNNPGNYLWQSFDYPTDTLLPGMKLGMNFVNHLQWPLKSWKSPGDPSEGNYTYRLDPRGYPQLILYSGTVEQLRAGPWNGLRFSGFPFQMPNPVFTYDFVFNEVEVYYHYELVDSSVISRLVLSHDGLAQRFTWVDRTHGWLLYLSGHTDNCDTYALCGAYGSCNINRTPQCGCLKGFEPKNKDDWDRADWSGGCARKTPLALDCSGDGFVKYVGVKVPDTSRSWFSKSMNLGECKLMCLRNCSCTAYTNLDIRAPGSGCLLWFDELIDIREFNENGQDLYIRLAASDIIAERNHKRKRLGIMVAAIISVASLFLGLALILLVWKRKRRDKGKIESKIGLSSRQENLELPLFDFATVANATNDFSDENKLGEGGFGPVYKATFEDGREVAVKRLSRTSRQGHEEFESGVVNISKLQHRNLVKLLGCSIHLEEKLLIYEYLPNKSLDYFIFGQENNMFLDWTKRFNIINGIARGLLYLHQDSILRIVHRDLKAENILLDRDMNPKISDFGMARSFGGNEAEANTNRVAGTRGYISPEYAVTGMYSTKSDVFSFGVLALEILSGKRNRRFRHIDHHLNLLGHAWKLHLEGSYFEFIDVSIRDSCCADPNVLRAFHVGLLCVQQFPEDRPDMANVIMMLSSDSAMPQPKQPAFCTETSLHQQEDLVVINDSVFSINDVTITQLEGR